MNLFKSELKYGASFFLISFSLLGFSTSNAADNVAETFSLQSVVEKTVSSNPEVQARYHAYTAAIQDQKSAEGGYYPKADLIYSLRAQQQLSPNIDNTENPDRQTQLVIRQMLFDGFATKNEVSRLGHIERVRYFELQSAIQNAALEIIKAYIDVQRYRQLVSYGQDNYVVHRQLFDQVQERVRAGIGRGVDLEQASGRLALAEANLLTDITNLHDVTTRYQRLAGELPPDNLPDFDFYQAGVSPTVNDALKLAYQKNPDLLAAIENIVATQDEVATKRAKYSPRFDLQATKNLNTSTNGENSTAAQDILQFTATFNLFNGFSDKANISQTVQKLNAAEDQRDKACVDTRQTVVIAYNDVQQLKEQMKYRDQHQLSTEKAREAYRKQFDIGQRTLLDLLDTENEYFQARRTYTITADDYLTAYARVYAAQGELLSRVGVARADLPDVNQDAALDEYKTCQADAPEQLVPNKDELVAKAPPLKTPPVSAPDATISQPNNIGKDKVVDAPFKLNDKDALIARVNDWADAWRKKDIATYLNFYSAQFVPAKLANKNAWVEQRKSRIASAGDIKLSLDIQNTSFDKDKAIVSFIQHYSANGYSDDVNKVLTFARENNNVWMIVSEEATPVK